MPRYIDADALLSRLPDDLPYKGSVKRVLMQAPTVNVAPMEDTCVACGAVIPEGRQICHSCEVIEND